MQQKHLAHSRCPGTQPLFFILLFSLLLPKVQVTVSLRLQLPGKSRPSEVGSGRRPDPGIRSHFPGRGGSFSPPATPTLRSLAPPRWKGEDAKNIPQSRKTNKRTKFKKNKGGTKVTTLRGVGASDLLAPKI